MTEEAAFNGLGRVISAEETACGFERGATDIANREGLVPVRPRTHRRHAGPVCGAVAYPEHARAWMGRQYGEQPLFFYNTLWSRRVVAASRTINAQALASPALAITDG